MQTPSKQSILTLEDRARLSLTGVEKVDSFSDRLIRLTVSGKKVRIEGSRLKVLAFSEGSGNFMAAGVVDAVRFGGDAKGLSSIFR